MNQAPPPRLQIYQVHKSFGPTRALQGVDLSLYPGEVLALVGENGAGKSTLMKILSGAHRPDSGKVEFEGKPYSPRNPQMARQQGVAMIYQELALAPHLTILENILLGRDHHYLGILSSRSERKLARHVLDQVGQPNLELDTKVHVLNPAQRQMVEIARAVAANASVLIMDEPTSSLTGRDVECLFHVIQDLKKRGTSILYISHFLEEVLQIADRVVVMRDGQTVGGGLIENFTIPDLVCMMVGREIKDQFPLIPHTAGKTILQISNLQGAILPKGINLEVRSGEILGIGGLVGAGRTEFFRALFGLDAIRNGTVRVSTNHVFEYSSHWSPRQMWNAGLGMVSEDRKNEGLAVGLSIAENMTLTSLKKYCRAGIFFPNRRLRGANRWVEQMGIVCRNAQQKVIDLSGGNQQKVALARLLHHDCDLLLLDEPTRGIDVGSKAQIYELIGQVAAKGKAIIMISSYLPELFGICDRLAVMSRGYLSEVKPISEWTEESIMQLAVTISNELN